MVAAVNVSDDNEVLIPVVVDEVCDYLVVGAGASGLSFIDTILTEQDTATVVLVDQNAGPGGHWTTAYPFVRLHQPSCFYGVNSEPLGKVFSNSSHQGRYRYEVFDYQDRATGAEVVAYYEKVVDKFRTNPRFKATYFECEYQKEEQQSSSFSSGNHRTQIHSIVRRKDGHIFRIQCRKLVTVHSKVVVPSMRTAPFPVHPGVNLIPVNALTNVLASNDNGNYIILGAGKTSIDAILTLLSSGIDPSSITWVISRDVWFFVRDKVYDEQKSHYERMAQVVDVMLAAPSVQAFFLAMEREGTIARLDPQRSPPPMVVKGPQITSQELVQLRSIRNVLRCGRITSIEEGGVMVFGENHHQVPLPQGGESGGGTSVDTTVFVDCMAEGFYGYTSFAENALQQEFKIFESPHKINLGPLLAVFNPSFSAAMVAYLESKLGNDDDDDRKNRCCYLATGKPTTTAEGKVHVDGDIYFFFDSFYCQIQSLLALAKVRPPSSLRFVLTSRTNSDNVHFHGGWTAFLWAQFGPLQLHRKVNRLVAKIESGGFADFTPHHVSKAKAAKAAKAELVKASPSPQPHRWVVSMGCLGLGLGLLKLSVHMVRLLTKPQMKTVQ